MTAPAADPVAADRLRHGVPSGSLVAAQAAHSKLGGETIVLAMAEASDMTDAFVITSGRNSRQVKTIVEEVELQVKRATGRSPVQVEGGRDLQWVLMDYGDFLVHVFLEETRRFYELERLWGDAPKVDWDRSGWDRPEPNHRPAEAAE
jgi:ribosome-associated protein